MKKKNYSARRKPVDCWNAHLLTNAQFSQKTELPLFKCSNRIPSDMVSFKNISPLEDKSKWIHFYEADERLEPIWENPEIWVDSFRQYAGIISPDLSVYQDMPIIQQAYDTYRNRVLAHFYSEQGIEVIPNIRWGDRESYDFCFDGIEPHGTVCISTNGVLRNANDRMNFQCGLAEMISRLSPDTIIVYGTMPEDIFMNYMSSDISFVQFDSDTQKAHRRGEE